MGPCWGVVFEVLLFTGVCIVIPSGLLWLLSLSPFPLSTLYLLGPPGALSLALFSCHPTQLHGPSHPLPDLHAKDSQIPISVPSSSYYYVLAVSWMPHSFLKPSSLSASRNVSLLSLPAICLANPCMLIKVQLAHCILSYALPGGFQKTMPPCTHCCAQGHVCWSLVEYLPQSFCSRRLCLSSFLLVCDQEDKIQPCPSLYIEHLVQFLGRTR